MRRPAQLRAVAAPRFIACPWNNKASGSLGSSLGMSPPVFRSQDGHSRVIILWPRKTRIAPNFQMERYLSNAPYVT